MRRPEGGGWRCSYGTWHGIDEHCRCAGAAVTPTDLCPVADRPGTTWRFYVVDHNTLIKRAVMEHDAAPHPAETVVRRPHFAKEAS